MKTVSVSSGKGAHFYLSADFSSDRVIQFLFGNRFFVHCFNVTFSFPVLVALTSSGFDSFIYSGMKTDLFNQP